MSDVKPLCVQDVRKSVARSISRANSMNRTAIFLALCKQVGIPEPELEYKFAKEAMGRKWRFDYAWPWLKVALEVDGGTWAGGRHTRGSGWQKDTDKLNAAAVLGWRMLRCTPQQLCTTNMLTAIRSALLYGQL